MATYANPSEIWDIDKGQDWLQIAWQASNDDVIVTHAFQYAEVKYSIPTSVYSGSVLIKCRNFEGAR